MLREEALERLEHASFEESDDSQKEDDAERVGKLVKHLEDDGDGESSEADKIISQIGTNTDAVSYVGLTSLNDPIPQPPPKKRIKCSVPFKEMISNNTSDHFSLSISTSGKSNTTSSNSVLPISSAQTENEHSPLNSNISSKYNNNNNLQSKAYFSFKVAKSKYNEKNCSSSHRKKSKQLPCVFCKESCYFALGAYSYFVDHMTKHAAISYNCKHCKQFFPNLNLLQQHWDEDVPDQFEDLQAKVVEQAENWVTLYCLFARQGVLDNEKLFPSVDWCKVCAKLRPELRSKHRPEGNTTDVLVPLIENFAHALHHMIYFRYTCLLCLETQYEMHKEKFECIKNDDTDEVPFEAYLQSTIDFPENAQILRKHLQEKHPDFSHFEPETPIIERFMYVGFIELSIEYMNEISKLCEVANNTKNEKELYLKSDLDQILHKPDQMIHRNGECNNEINLDQLVPLLDIATNKLDKSHTVEKDLIKSFSYKLAMPLESLEEFDTDCEVNRYLPKTERIKETIIPEEMDSAIIKPLFPDEIFWKAISKKANTTTTSQTVASTNAKQTSLPKSQPSRTLFRKPMFDSPRITAKVNVHSTDVDQPLDAISLEDINSDEQMDQFEEDDEEDEEVNTTPSFASRPSHEENIRLTVDDIVRNLETNF